MRHVATFIMVLAALGCGADSVSSAAHDSGAVRDASARDASARDASAHDAATADAGGASCPADTQSAVGQACASENRYCGKCTDPCQFCNLLHCQNGHWENLETFPKPCDGGGVADAMTPAGDAGLAGACTASGGTVGSSLCCAGASDFPDTCAVGACGCAPASSKQVATCVCPGSKCWDGAHCQ